LNIICFSNGERRGKRKEIQVQGCCLFVFVARTAGEREKLDLEEKMGKPGCEGGIAAERGTNVRASGKVISGKQKKNGKK